MGGKEKNSNPSLVRKVSSGDLPDVWVCLQGKSSQLGSTSTSSGVGYPQGPLPHRDERQSQEPHRGHAEAPMCSTTLTIKSCFAWLSPCAQ